MSADGNSLPGTFPADPRWGPMEFDPRRVRRLEEGGDVAAQPAAALAPFMPASVRGGADDVGGESGWAAAQTRSGGVPPPAPPAFSETKKGGGGEATLPADASEGLGAQCRYGAEVGREFAPGEAIFLRTEAGDRTGEPEEDAPTDERRPAAPGRRLSATAWAVRLLGPAVLLLLAIGLALDVADLIGRAFAAGWAVGAPVAALLIVIAGALGWLAWLEVVALGRLRRIDRLRLSADCLIAAGGYGRAAPLVQEMVTLYADRSDLRAGINALTATLTDAEDDRTLLTRADRLVLEPLDRIANRRILAAGRTTALTTALSPSTILDLGLVAWRALVLVRELAELYGGRPGVAGGWRIGRHVLAALFGAGVAEATQSTLAETLGGGLAGAISSRLGQGVMNGLLTVRIGVAAMQVCRPLPLPADRRPRLRRLIMDWLSETASGARPSPTGGRPRGETP